MQLEFVNHASLVLAAEGVRLITDPWLEGRAFDDGWALLSETRFRYEDFADITHIWFSHEHPDHFSPLCLRKIPEEHRARIVVLYQETLDKKVVDFCRGLGFREVIELAPGARHALAPRFHVTCRPYLGFHDSWLYVETPGCRLLNVNDCAIFTEEAVRAVKAQVGEVDVLLTQFSISSWDGDLEQLKRGARTMLERTVMHTEVFDARCVIPFASFIWFPHEENAHMNAAFLPIDEVERTLRERTDAQVVLMYPGDSWRVGEQRDNTEAVRRYAADQASLADRERVRGREVPREELIASSHAFCRMILDGSSRSKLRFDLARSTRAWGHAHRTERRSRLGRLLRLARLDSEPARVFVSDHRQAYLFDLDGLRPVDLAPEECDVIMGAAALHYAFRFLWGGDTLHINGRFRETRPSSRTCLFQYFSTASQKNGGHHVLWRTLPASAVRRLTAGLR